jgi:CheY-like chemotaxis protein
VQDNGIGIAPEFLPRLFDQFSQVEASMERSGGGLGVGLSLANTLIEMHGGSISAHSEGPDRGSTFVVRLPLALDARTAAPQVPHGASPPAPGRRILVVDDNRDNTDSLALLLQLEGHEARTAYDGVDGVELADRWRPDVVLLDIGMPRRNGYDACRLIRSRPWGAEPVLIAQTGWGQDVDKRRASGEGFDAHVVKPVDCGELLNLIEALLARREAGRVGAVDDRL